MNFCVGLRRFRFVICFTRLPPLPLELPAIKQTFSLTSLWGCCGDDNSMGRSIAVTTEEMGIRAQKMMKPLSAKYGAFDRLMDVVFVGLSKPNNLASN